MVDRLFKLYNKTAVQPMRPYVPGEDLTGVSVNAEDTPELGGMVAINPDNPADQWYVGKEFFEKNYILADQPVAPAAQSPSVGRVVHYVAFGTPNGEYPAGVCRAAIITKVWAVPHPDSPAVGLAILNPTGMFFNESVLYDENKAAGTWHWPERD